MAIVTLIAAGCLDDRLIDRALGSLREIDPKAAFAAWIDEGDAVDLKVSGDLKAIRWALDGMEGVDVFVQPEENRFKRLLVADMDSTIVGQECIDELADFAGLKREIAEITERAMQGKLDFKSALRERVAMLSGLDEESIQRCVKERVIPNPGAATLIRTMRVGGAYCMLVTGGFVSFADPIAKLLGFNSIRANRLLFDGGLLSGSVEDPIVDAQSKVEALVEMRSELGLSPDQVLAVGDGANDRLMVEEAGLGVAFRAKPALAEVADARLDHHGLDALLWAQGIRRRDWVVG
ncbi:phosphoserine phosphatase SerB [Sphingomonas daechungensis]|uniref:Phosphoserine phosphatase n=1 Tax=Sphingomonas daechungensis TaxID=1176646 RepID=A0ABX6SY78_9SPHN|nr:phosphoserine phosphatase SerB [Sphingomonas daechungensis]QNP42544.1 phosphoserine phosphatase SerB [Sphingomonas daechungensis]